VPRFLGAVSVSVFIVLIAISYGLNLTATPLSSVPIFLVLTILFVTSGSLVVSYIAARAYMKEGVPSMLFLGSGSLIFGLTSLVAAVDALMAGERASNPATTIFVVGALLSTVLHLACAASRSFGNPNRHGKAPVATITISAALLLVVSITVAAFDRALPTFLIPGEGPTLIAEGLLVVAIGASGLASLLIIASSSASGVLYWYSSAMATTAVGFAGILLSDWAFTSVMFLVGRTALCLAGAFLVWSVRSAEKQTGVRPDSALEELFKPS
jgi:hypothetical protein